MKNLSLKLLILLAIGLVSSFSLKAQSKSELSEMLSAKTIELEAKEKELKAQNKEMAIMEHRLSELEEMYDATKARLDGKDFEPTEFKAILDSAQKVGLRKDSVYSSLKVENVELLDSLTLLSKTVVSCTDSVSEQESVISNCLEILNLISNNPVTRKDVEEGLSEEREQVLRELKQLRDLLKSGILTQEEFEAKSRIVKAKW